MATGKFPQLEVKDDENFYLSKVKSFGAECERAKNESCQVSIVPKCELTNL
jgi:hypothetical protein